jgi:hypothetical protein
MLLRLRMNSLRLVFSFLRSSQFAKNLPMQH